MVEDKLIGTVDEFHSKKCFDLYMYAVGLAKQINKYIDEGYIIFYEDRILTNKFVFYGINTPFVAERNGNCNFIYVGGVYDKNGLTWLHGEETKTTIKNKFSKFEFVKPFNIEKIKFN